MKVKKLIATSSLAILLASTSGAAYADGGKLLGTLLGAAGGAAVGSNVGKGKGNIVAIAVGTLLGAGVGNSVGKSIDHSNNSYHKTASYNPYPAAANYHVNPYPANPVYGQTDYVVPNYQHVAYTPQPAYAYNSTVTTVNTNVAAEPYCREFIQTITVGGRTQDSYGKACRQPDGAWELQN